LKARRLLPMGLCLLHAEMSNRLLSARASGA
jgi:hypothetical protein